MKSLSIVTYNIYILLRWVSIYVRENRGHESKDGKTIYIIALTRIDLKQAEVKSTLIQKWSRRGHRRKRQLSMSAAGPKNRALKRTSLTTVTLGCAVRSVLAGGGDLRRTGQYISQLALQASKTSGHCLAKG